MNKSQTIEIINIINNNYKNFFDESRLDNIIKEWNIELSQYDYDDIKEALIECMSKSEFQMKPPTLYHITSKCQKKHDKINLSSMIYFCNKCHRPFDSMELLSEHRDRCNSVIFICNQWKKWYGKDLTKADIRTLYEMEEVQFRERYNKLLHYIYEHTQDENEKILIGYIFNPPNQETAQDFIKNTSF